MKNSEDTQHYLGWVVGGIYEFALIEYNIAIKRSFSQRNLGGM